MLRPALTGPVPWIFLPIYVPVDGSCVPDYRVRGRRPRTTGAGLLVAPPDPGLCEDGSATEYVVGRIKRVRTRLLSALPLALLALEDGGSALPLADSDYCTSLRYRPHDDVRSYRYTGTAITDTYV